MNGVNSSNDSEDGGGGGGGGIWSICRSGICRGVSVAGKFFHDSASVIIASMILAVAISKVAGAVSEVGGGIERKLAEVGGGMERKLAEVGGGIERKLDGLDRVMVEALAGNVTVNATLTNLVPPGLTVKVKVGEAEQIV